MNEGKISKRYARALLSYAIDLKSEDAVYLDVKKMVEVFTEESKLRLILRNPMSRTNDKLHLLNAIFDNKPSTIISNFFDLILKKRREGNLWAISLSFIDLYHELRNINSVKLVTAIPANDAMVERMKLLAQKIKSGEMLFETKVDPAIEGGFMLYIGTYRLDASVKSQLKKIKQKLTNVNNSISI